MHRLQTEDEKVNDFDKVYTALRNCYALAKRHRDEPDWEHVVRFCHEAGISDSPLRSSNDS